MLTVVDGRLPAVLILGERAVAEKRGGVLGTQIAVLELAVAQVAGQVGSPLRLSDRRELCHCVVASLALSELLRLRVVKGA